MAYREKIIIQQTTESRGDAGGTKDAWATYKTVYAEIDDLSGSKDNTADMPVYEDGMSFKIHKDDAPDVTTKMRISYEGDIWCIRSRQKDVRRGYITLIADSYDDE
ncbi:hypothetical protein LCGC14_1576050 [marine sediment metagenome]|uniref:Phage head-tail adaptor n=1 Tax=marine sediment metagenome TaxID=412755 RepID=A0A0F9II91_9ZZZZ